MATSAGDFFALKCDIEGVGDAILEGVGYRAYALLAVQLFVNVQ